LKPKIREKADIVYEFTCGCKSKIHYVGAGGRIKCLEHGAPFWRAFKECVGCGIVIELRKKTNRKYCDSCSRKRSIESARRYEKKAKDKPSMPYDTLKQMIKDCITFQGWTEAEANQCLRRLERGK